MGSDPGAGTLTWPVEQTMEEESNMEQLTLRLDDNEEMNAFTLSTLLNSGVEEALSNLSPAQLMQLEKNVQRLKKAKNTTTPVRRRTEGSPAPSRKRRMSDGESPRVSSQYMNLPASAPRVELRDSREWLLFTYSTKGHVQEYCIHIDIDELSLDEIPDDFKTENCVYPRALVPREAYVGNRWEYETSVNEIAWKLTWLNPSVLCGKRGLTQRAVDSYRNRVPESRSRRVVRQEKMHAGILRRRTLDSVVDTPGRGPAMLTFHWTTKGVPAKCRIRVDVDSVDTNQLDAEFKRINSLYPTNDRGLGTGQWEYEAHCNELAWKLAYLNSTKLAGKKQLLQKAVEAYRNRFEEQANRRMRYDDEEHAELDAHVHLGAADYGGDDTLDKSEAFSEMVAQTLHQALSTHDHDHDHDDPNLDFDDHLDHDDDDVHHDDDDDDDDDDDEHNPATVSTADLLNSM